MKYQFFVALLRGILVFFLFLAVVFILVSLGIADARDLSLAGLLLWAGVFGSVAFLDKFYTYLISSDES